MNNRVSRPAAVCDSRLAVRHPSAPPLSRGHAEVIRFDSAEASRAGRTTPARSPAPIPTPDRGRQDAFVAILGHELRQPLSSLAAAVDLLRQSPQDEVAARVTALMHRQIRHMTRLVDDLLDQARWTYGKVALRKERVDVRQVIRDAAHEARAAVAGRGLSLAVTVPTGPLWADADVQRLHQVLGNLIDNAAKCTEPGGRIALSAEPDADGITVRVRDTGRGIAPEALTGIFDLFAQVGPSDGVGLGLGLSVAREIVTSHDGRIAARSAGPGQGSEFVIQLPAAADSNSGAEAIG